MTMKGRGVRRSEIPLRYVESNPNGNRAARRMAVREEKAGRRGRDVGASTGAAPLRRRETPAPNPEVDRKARSWRQRVRDVLQRGWSTDADDLPL